VTDPEDDTDDADSMTRFVRSLVAYVVLAGASWVGVALAHQRLLHGALQASVVLFSLLAAWCLGWLLVMVVMAVRSVNRRGREQNDFEHFEQQFDDHDDHDEP